MSVYGLELEVSVGNDTGPGVLQRFAVAFERGGEAIADFPKYVWPRLTPALEQAEATQFDAQGTGPVAGAWAALSPSYAAWKEGVAPGMPTLEFSGLLRNALTSPAAPGARREASGDAFLFGTQGVPYASFHQTGTQRMPARPPFDFGATFEDAMKKAVMEGLRAAIKESSRGQLELEGGAS